MLPAEIIRKKRDGGTLSADEISTFIGGYVRGEVQDYQASALTMAIFFQGMTPQETAELTRAMMNSGITYKLDVNRPLIDKHSTGGVGDKVSLILAPLAAACGLAVPMVAGRGLGHTGGTIDKLESIPGFNVNLSTQAFYAQVESLGVALVGQSDDFVPADKKLYALRDVTATVESIPLLCSSILSKKAASGAKGIVMDVKCGSGAFMSSIDGARDLAAGLVSTGEALGLPVRCLITDMNQPLGRAVGNALEVIESIECLQGGGPADLREIVLELVAEMVLLGEIDTTKEQALQRATSALDDNSAWEIFRQMVQQQGGDLTTLDNPSKLLGDVLQADFVAEQDGFVIINNCRDVGIAGLLLGAGRRTMSDVIDPAVGLIMQKKAGDKVSRGEPVVTIYYRDEAQMHQCRQQLKQAISIAPQPPSLQPLIIERHA